MNKSEQYTDTYMGIPYEIRHWRYSDGKPAWAFYIYLRERQLPDRFKEIWLKGKKMENSRFISYKYERTFIGNLEWHMGCTFYEKVSGFDGADRAVKVGCDYQHLYDKGKYYDEIEIERDVKSCIKSLHEQVKIFQWCRYCGEYFEEVNEQVFCNNCPPSK